MSTQSPFGWVSPKNGNYFTRSETTARRIGGLVPVYLSAPGERSQVLDEVLDALYEAGHGEAYEVVYRMTKEQA